MSVCRLTRVFQTPIDLHYSQNAGIPAIIKYYKSNDLPSTELDKVKFFQSLPIAITQDVVIIIDQAINLTIPPFTHSLTVGHGYDVLKDEVLPPTSVPFSPVAFDTWMFSRMGYLLPSFLSCDQLQKSEFQKHLHFAASFKQSVEQRQTFLDYTNKKAFSTSNFDGQLRMGFNIKPSNEDVPALSCVKEIRTHKMQLNDRVEFSEEFQESVGQLSPFDSSVRESEKEWRSFFEKWGTHVVSSGFVGGFIQGTVISEGVASLYQNESHVQNALEQICNFTKVEVEGGVTFYGVFGGDKDPKLTDVQELSAADRNDAMQRWEYSLSYEPVVLNYQMELMPISSLIGLVNGSMGLLSRIALDSFLQGSLKYQRVKRDRTTTSGGFRQPSVISTESTATMSLERSAETLSVEPTTTAFPLIPTSDPIVPDNFLHSNNNTINHNSSLSVYEIKNSTLEFHTNTSTNVCEGIPKNDTHATILLLVCSWEAGNRHRAEFIESYLKDSTFKREQERMFFEEREKIHKERLENDLRSKRKRQQDLTDLLKREQEEREINRAKQVELHAQQMEKEDQARAKETRELEREIRENEEKLRMYKEANEERKKNTSWQAVVYRNMQKFGRAVVNIPKSMYNFVVRKVKKVYKKTKDFFRNATVIPQVYYVRRRGY